MRPTYQPAPVRPDPAAPGCWLGHDNTSFALHSTAAYYNQQRTSIDEATAFRLGSVS